MNEYNVDAYNYLLKYSQSIIRIGAHIYSIKDVNSRYIDCSEPFLKFIQKKKKGIIGKYDYDLPWGEYAGLYREIDRRTLDEHNIISIVPVIDCSCKISHSLAKKTTIKDNNGNIIGLLKHSKVLKDTDDIVSINFLKAFDAALFGLKINKHFYFIKNSYEPLNLSQQESSLLFYYARGLSYQKISCIYPKIDEKNIKCALNNIKHKLEINSISEIITLLIETKQFNVIPSGINIGHIFNLFNS